jgi:hypothetical protein
MVGLTAVAQKFPDQSLALMDKIKSIGPFRNIDFFPITRGTRCRFSE